MIDPTMLVIPALGAAASAGAAWGAVKVSLNGTRQRVKNIEVVQAETSRSEGDTKDRLARLETKIDLLLIGRSLQENMRGGE